MTHQPYLSPTGRDSGHFVLARARLGSVAVPEHDDKGHPQRAEDRSQRWRADRRPGPSWAQ